MNNISSNMHVFIKNLYMNKYAKKKKIFFNSLPSNTHFRCEFFGRLNKNNIQ